MVRDELELALLFQREENNFQHDSSTPSILKVI